MGGEENTQHKHHGKRPIDGLPTPAEARLIHEGAVQIQLEDLRKGQEAIRLQQKLEEVRTNIIFSLIQLRDKIGDRKDAWIGPGGVSKTVGSAYVNAYTRFKTTQSNQAAWDNFMTQLGFSVLSLCCAGALSHIFNFKTLQTPYMPPLGRVTSWKLTNVKKLVEGPGLQDMIKEAASETFDVPGILPKLQEIQSDDVVPEPMQFQNALEGHLDKQFQYHRVFFDELVDMYKNTPASKLKPNADKTLDLLIQNYMNMMNMPGIAAPKQIDKEPLTNELEIGLWAAWIIKWLSDPRVRALYGYGYGQDFGDYIKQRIRQLGILKQAGIVLDRVPEIFSRGTIWEMNPHRANMLYKWAKNWKPTKTFGMF